MILLQKHVFVFKKINFENLTFFLTFFDLTLNRFSIFFVQMKSKCKITVTIEFFVQNGP